MSTKTMETDNTLVIAIIAILASFAGTAFCAEKPNIVLFLVDDMGWMDSTPYGSRYYETPQMERLAKQGLRFTQAYAQPLCSPTRASILTGQSAARHGMTAPAGHSPPRPSPGAPITCTFLAPEQYTLAEALRDAGYRTGHFGKWHLGLTEPHWPEAQGFDVAFHAQPSAGPPGQYFSPYNVRPPGDTRPKEKGAKYFAGTITDGPPGEYITDRLTDEAIEFIQSNKDKAFYLNLWHYAVHGPWGHKVEYTREFARKTDPTGRQGNPVMASMLKSVDESLGRILDELDRLGLAQNTIMIFASDNGGNSSTKKMQTVDNYREWAGERTPTNNAPLRDGKGSLYEGGTRIPLMIRWPGLVSAGTTTEAIVHAYDLYPTLRDILDLPKPAQQTMDGISFAPVLRDPAAKLPERPIIIAAQNGCSVRLGDWKLVRDYQKPAFELYNLADDLGETNDLIARNPEKANELEVLLMDHFAATTGIPRALKARD
ncbi:MAG: sulfatase [Planctomycetota bacterium]